MQPPLHVVDAGESIDRVFADLTAGSPAVVVADGGRPAGMLTRSDLLEYLAAQREPGHSMISVEALRRHVIAAQGYTGRRRTSGVAGRRSHDSQARSRAARLDLDRRPQPPPDAGLPHRRHTRRRP